MGGTLRTLYWLDATDTNDQFGGRLFPHDDRGEFDPSD
jgi:hypothetical protein